MAGTEIVYKGYFKDDNGNDCAVYIKKDSYAGAETEVTMGAEPVVIKWVGDTDDKTEHIKASECYLEFVTETSMQFLSLFLEPVKTYRVEIYRGVDPIWNGFVNPEYYSEPFIHTPYITTIHCTDGLADLKNTPFPIPGYTSSDFKQTVISYISTCLEQIGGDSTLDIYNAVNVICNTPTDGIVSARIMEYLYIDYRSIQDETGAFWSCYDVLNEIMAAFNARLYQSGYQWWIERIDQKHDTFRVEVYDLSGMYKSTIAARDEQVALTSITPAKVIRFVNTPAQLEINPAYKSFDIEQDYQHRTNFINSTSYTTFRPDDWASDTSLRFWTVNGTVNYEKDFEYNVLRIKDRFTDVGNFLYNDAINFQNEGVSNINNLMVGWRNGIIALVISFDVQKRFYGVQDGETATANIYCYMSFSGNVYRLTNDSGSTYNILGQQLPLNDTRTAGTFTMHNVNNIGRFVEAADPSTPYITTDLKDTSEWVTTIVEFKRPPSDEDGNTQTYLTLQMRLFSLATNSADTFLDSDGVLYRNMRVYWKRNMEDDYMRTIETDIDEANIVVPDAYQVKFGNTPAPFISPAGKVNDGYSLINRHVFFDSAGKPVNDFGVVGDATVTSDLIDKIIVDDLTATYRRPLCRLRGTILDETIASGSTAGLKFSSVLKDYNNRWYAPLSLAYYMRGVQWEGNWLEFWNETGTGEFSDDFSEDFFI